MGIGSAWTSFWQRHDPDKVFSYSTTKKLQINDRRLGITYYVFAVIVFAYIVGYSIFYNRGYLRIASPVGIVRFTLREPGSFSDPSTLPYCSSAPGVECQFLDYLSVQHPDVEQNALFVTTYFWQQLQQLNCDPTSPTCVFSPVWNSTYNQEVFVAQVEAFTLGITHRVRSPLADIVGDPSSMKGSIQRLVTKKDWRGAEVWEDDIVFDYGTDFLILPLGRLLTNGQINLDGDFVNNESLRRRGFVLFLVINYDNTIDFFNLGKIRYTIRPYLMTESEFKVEQVVHTNYTQERMVIDRHGIRIVALQEGRLGSFDFAVLLIQITVSLTLMRIATMVLDVVMLYLLPDRIHYRRYKYEQTEDFSELRQRIVDEEEQLERKQSRMHNIFKKRERTYRKGYSSMDTTRAQDPKQTDPHAGGL